MSDITEYTGESVKAFKKVNSKIKTSLHLDKNFFL